MQPFSNKGFWPSGPHHARMQNQFPNPNPLLNNAAGNRCANRNATQLREITHPSSDALFSTGEETFLKQYNSDRNRDRNRDRNQPSCCHIQPPTSAGEEIVKM